MLLDLLKFWNNLLAEVLGQPIPVVCCHVRLVEMIHQCSYRPSLAEHILLGGSSIIAVTSPCSVGAPGRPPVSPAQSRLYPRDCTTVTTGRGQLPEQPVLHHGGAINNSMLPSYLPPGCILRIR
ncbi:hypothetical protein Bbelb_298420 [Branchiostoma belcheri]|nr:hypothetical protein Bbelb_298420 [Branchiostoma belcheri]